MKIGIIYMRFGVLWEVNTAKIRHAPASFSDRSNSFSGRAILYLGRAISYFGSVISYLGRVILGDLTSLI